MLTVPLAAAACSTGYEALGTHTARVLVNGSEIAEHPSVSCEQAQWVWFIDSLQENPGFTGSSWNATVTAPSTPSAVAANAEIADGTFTITGTAMGFYQDDPAETATASFEIRTDC